MKNTMGKVFDSQIAHDIKVILSAIEIVLAIFAVFILKTHGTDVMKLLIK